MLASTYAPDARPAPATASIGRTIGAAPAARPAEAPRRSPRVADFGQEPLSDDARAIASWVVDAADNRGLPFAIVDKVNARVAVFNPDGRIAASTPALLGLARGDDSVPGIGERKISDIKPHERTTPAGRFVAEIGVNANGEDILWVDYDAAVSMHRVRNGNKAERRLQRLATATVADNRISYGCINLPVAFYEQYIKRLFEARGGIVYVLPETRPVLAQFGAYRVASATP
ncbi:L,D-transpeptidase [Schlegelella sp. ID0723]|uniref:L,D-transpeptidase n=1 Tax=Piscinibacter koreensis TaxID=2742824 RepID=A0A7Y6NJ68_9BURK|nr:L,D-transpeptidase [Schlegelella koreensis]